MIMNLLRLQNCYFSWIKTFSDGSSESNNLIETNQT